MSGRKLGPAPSASGDGALTRSAVAAAMGGDPEGVHFLYARFANEVRRYLGSVLADDDLAAELTRDIFAELTTTIRTYREREAPFDAWLMRMAEDAVPDRRRGAHLDPSPPAMPVIGPAPSDS